jgi:hypothetical protein
MEETKKPFIEPCESTKNIYDHHLKRFKNVDITDAEKTLDLLNKMENLHNHKNLAPSSIKTILCSFIYKLKKENPDSPAIRQYRYIIAHLRNQLEKRDRNNHITKSNYKIPEWEDIIKKRDDLKKENLRDHLILSLYSYIPPRRLLDLIKIKIAYTPEQITDTNFNYYVISKRYLIFNVYKTAKTHKRQFFEVPEELHDIIMNYIKKKKLKEGDSLLGIDNVGKLHYRLKKLIGCGVDNIRHSFVNEQYKKFDIPTNEYMENLADSMGHSLETHLRYRKF